MTIRSAEIAVRSMALAFLIAVPSIALATTTSPLPPERPSTLAPAAPERVTPPRSFSEKPRPAVDGSPANMVCRDPRLQGREQADVIGTLPGCVIIDPVRFNSILGIKLSAPATLDCRTARAFANWVTGVADPAAKDVLGRRIKSVTIYGTYSCRTRNNKKGARLSEHAVGRAVDVAGFTLGDGTKVSVLKDWGKGFSGKFLRRIWKQACGPFKTVIGPEGDKYHRDHLHLDTAFRSRSYCR